MGRVELACHIDLAVIEGSSQHGQVFAQLGERLLNSKPYAAIIVRWWLVPMPSRNLPGARSSIASAWVPARAGGV